MDDDEIRKYPSALLRYVETRQQEKKNVYGGVCSRLETLSTYENSTANVYSLARIPLSCCWGKHNPYTNHSKILCNPASDEPVLVWLMGHISSTWFMRNSEPDRQCSVTIVPLSRDLSRYANRLLCGFSSPPLRAYTSILKPSASPTLFSSVYDAREVFCAKNEMMPYPPTELKRKDLVLMEMWLCCYFTKDDSNRYSQFRAQFELNAVSVLHSADDTECEDKPENDIGDFRI
ncbi:hypothetical protein EDD15DRAFT_2162947 [Pisolithus albus]|nr:hypothetical protein EDD15DRAFT_2162947 [Pisolithus albus]